MGLTDFTIVLNNRKILAGMAEVFGISDRLTDFTVALDKLDKIGVDGVLQELNNRGFDSDSTGRIDAFLSKMTSVSSADETLSFVRDMLSESEIGLLGVQETEFIVNKVAPLGMKGKLKLDLTLARGLNYYTGAIFEVKARGVAIGSICGGGRYDDLTGVFGLPGMSGVGISFGADRIYDVLLELNLFPEFLNNAPDVVFANFGPEEAARCLPLVRQMRMMGLRTELYPDSAKMKKQFKYADDRKAKLMVIGGPDEWAKNVLTVKNMASGEQQEVPISKLIETVLTMIGH
jgi:histidyl-tRNA synthetase